MRNLFIIAICLVVSACSFETVPPAHKGKILTTAGYKPELVPPSKLTLWGRDRLILVETATNVFKEKMTVLMSDRLELTFDVRGRMRLSNDDKVIHAMFNDVVPNENSMVTTGMVYAKYGQMLVRNKAREVLSVYSIEDVHKKYAELSKQIYDELTESFKGTPLSVSDVAIGQIKFPQVVTTAVESQKEREIAVGRERAQVEIELTKKRGEEQLAEASYRIRMIKAKTIRDENRTISESVTSEYLAYRKLEVMEMMAESGSTVFMPFEATGTTAAQIRMFQAGK